MATATSVITCYLTPELISSLLKWTRVFQCLVLALLIFPFIIVVGSIILIWRLIIAVYYKVVQNGKFKLCSPADAAFALEEPGNLITMQTFGFFKGSIDLSKLQERVKKAIMECKSEDGRRPYDKLTWKLSDKLGFFTWEVKNDTFDITQHVKPCQGIDSNKVYTEKGVQELAETFLDVPVSSEKPQWEVLYVPNVRMGGNSEDIDDDQHYALIFRVQHAYFDGVSLLLLFKTILGDQPDIKLIIDPVKPPMYQPSTLELIAIYLQALIMSPYIYRQNLRFISINNAFQNKIKNKGPKYYTCNKKEITLDSLKIIRNRLNCSITAIVASAATGAIRKAGKRKNLVIPEQVNFAVTTALIPYPNYDPGNRFTLKLLQTPMSITDSVKRLNKVNSEVKSLTPVEVIALYHLSLLVGLLPVKFIGMIYDFVECGFAVSNLPGYVEKVTLFGSTLEKLYGAPPIKNGVGKFDTNFNLHSMIFCLRNIQIFFML